jgi:hypothetical protein
MTRLIESILPKVKANLVLTHNEDDELLRNIIRAALDYAFTYQKIEKCHRLPASSEQAVIILSSHWYESRDGSTGGFFADNSNAVNSVWQTVHRLLAVNKNIVV